MNKEQILEVAKQCHIANRIYCKSIGDNTQPLWEEAPQWQIDSAIKGVEYHISNPYSEPCDSHKSWLKEKVEAGWVYGDVKDPVAKTHYCIVNFEDLPEEQQLKDVIFLATVHECLDIIDKYTIQKDVIFNKILRKRLDKDLQIIKSLKRSRERSLSITKIQEAIMWLGMDLKRLNEPNPYPNSYNTSNTVIEPTADNLKL